MTSARINHIPRGWWGFVSALLAALGAQYAYGLLLVGISAIMPSLLQVWTHGGVGQRAMFDIPLLVMVLTVAVLMLSRRRAFAAGLLSYVAIVGVWYGAVLLGTA